MKTMWFLTSQVITTVVLLDEYPSSTCQTRQAYSCGRRRLESLKIELGCRINI